MYRYHEGQLLLDMTANSLRVDYQPVCHIVLERTGLAVSPE